MTNPKEVSNITAFAEKKEGQDAIHEEIIPFFLESDLAPLLLSLPFLLSPELPLFLPPDFLFLLDPEEEPRFLSVGMDEWSLSMGLIATDQSEAWKSELVQPYLSFLLGDLERELDRERSLLGLDLFSFFLYFFTGRTAFFKTKSFFVDSPITSLIFLSPK